MVALKKFLEEAKGELEKVTWPTKSEVTNLTIIVVVVSLVVGLFLTGADFAFSKVIKFILGL